VNGEGIADGSIGGRHPVCVKCYAGGVNNGGEYGSTNGIRAFMILFGTKCAIRKGRTRNEEIDWGRNQDSSKGERERGIEFVLKREKVGILKER
jgi:hypothetical protein